MVRLNFHNKIKANKVLNKNFKINQIEASIINYQL